MGDNRGQIRSYPRWAAPRTILGAGLGICVLATVVSPSVGLVLFAIAMLAAWLTTLATACFLPVPQPVATMSALAARVTWMVRAFSAVVLFGVTATYSALVAINIEARIDENRELDVVQVAIEPSIALAGVLPWFCAMWVSVDLCRARADGRSAAIRDLVEFTRNWTARGATALDLPPTRWTVSRSRHAAAWITELVETILKPVPVLVLAYLGPIVIYLLLDAALRPVSPGSSSTVEPTLILRPIPLCPHVRA